MSKEVLTIQPPYSKEMIAEDLVILINSCTEGISGEWVPGDDPDGFEAMRDGLYALARNLGLTLPEDQLKDEDDFDPFAIDEDEEDD